MGSVLERHAEGQGALAVRETARELGVYPVPRPRPIGHPLKDSDQIVERRRWDPIVQRFAQVRQSIPDRHPSGRKRVVVTLRRDRFPRADIPTDHRMQETVSAITA